MTKLVFSSIERDAIWDELLSVGLQVETNKDRFIAAMEAIENTLRNTEAWKREQAVKALSHYVSEDSEEALRKLENAAEDSDLADNYVLMWSPLSDLLTVEELLNVVL